MKQGIQFRKRTNDINFNDLFNLRGKQVILGACYPHLTNPMVPHIIRTQSKPSAMLKYGVIAAHKLSLL